MKLSVLIVALGLAAAGCAQNNGSGPAPSPASTPQASSSSLAPVATKPDTATPTATAATSKSWQTTLSSNGHSINDIDLVSGYVEGACAMLTENPGLRTQWTQNLVQSEVNESYGISLNAESANAILKSC